MAQAESYAKRPSSWGCAALIILVGIILLLLICVPVLIVGLFYQEKDFVYSAKFVCVDEVGPAAVDDVEAPFEPANYRTVINVHNFSNRTIEFTKKAVLARSEDLERGPISEKVRESLRPDEALAIDCIDISGLFSGPDQLGSQPIGDGFVVIESDVSLDVAAVYTTQLVEEKQEILYRFVTEPFKVRVVKRNGAERDMLPDPGEPPFQGFHVEVLSVDFEKTFGVLNKVIYVFEEKSWDSDCSGYDKCSGTREILIPAPESGVPFPDPNGPEGEPKSLEELIRDSDQSLKKILDVDATMFQKDEIKQEVTYRWVSDPIKIVVDVLPDVGIDVRAIVEDDDQDGQVNEDPRDGVDNDGDDLLDEDPPPMNGQEIEIIDTDIAISVGQSEDVEYIQPAVLKSWPRLVIDRTVLVVAIVVVVVVVVVVIIGAIIYFLSKRRKRVYG